MEDRVVCRAAVLRLRVHLFDDGLGRHGGVVAFDWSAVVLSLRFLACHCLRLGVVGTKALLIVVKEAGNLLEVLFLRRRRPQIGAFLLDKF